MDTINDRINAMIAALGIRKTDLARQLNISDASVSNICSGKTNPSGQTITAIVREFNVNEAWLRTGEGEMFLPKSSSEELADFFGQVLSDKPEAFRRRLAVALSKLSEKQWAEIADIVDTLVASLSEE